MLDAAERLAAEIKEEAREWARQHTEEARQKADEQAAERMRRLSGLTEDLGSRARAIARECNELLNAIREAAERSTPEGGGAKLKIAPDEPQETDGVSDPIEAAGPGSPGEPPISDRARLIAGQMIAAGDPRDKISTRLREEFGIQDASAMLDRMGA